MSPLLDEKARIDREEEKDRRRRRRERILIIVIGVLFVAITLLGVHLGRDFGSGSVFNSLLFFALLNLNVILITLLIFLVFRNVVKLYLERKSKLFGSRLKTKLVIAFVCFSIFPTILMFFISLLYINNSFDKWFSYRVGKSIRGSLRVVNAYYQDMTQLGFHFGDQIGTEVSKEYRNLKESPASLKSVLEDYRKKFRLDGVELYFSPDGGREILNFAPKYAGLPLPRPSPELLGQAFHGYKVSDLSKVAKGDMIRCIVPVYGRSKVPTAVLVASYYIPHNLVSKIERITELFHEYKDANSMQYPIKTLYVILLLMISLLIAFAATWLGFYLTKQLTIPIEMLAEGTQEVAAGNYDVQIDSRSFAEFSGLINTFNKMTRDLKESSTRLAEANRELHQRNVEVDRRRRYMEIVLKHVTTGVVSVDSDGVITTINEAATELFGVNSDYVIGKRYQDLIPAAELKKLSKLGQQLDLDGATIEKQIKMNIRGETLSLFVALTPLCDEEGKSIGILAVFDDVTELEKAQRMSAWQEVARRIAHEIKNPLTPIKLSAQRLRKRFASQIKTRQDIFDDCTSTIIKQVDDLRDLVNEFSTFARLPEANPMPNSLSEIIQEVMVLFQEGHKGIRFFYHEKNPVPIFYIDKEQLKRVFINLFDNAVTAMDGKGELGITADYKEALQIVRVEVSDTGPGIAESIKSRLFEPYFSTKEGGTGLGLSIVKRIVADHNGFIRVAQNLPKGTTFIIELPANRPSAIEFIRGRQIGGRLQERLPSA